MQDQSGLIHWRCEAAAHRQGADGRTPDTLTVRDGSWAYCPMDVAATGHDWKNTGGVRIEMLRRGSPTIDLDLDIGPPVDRASSTEGPRGRAAARAGGGTTTRKRTTPKG